MAWRRSTCCGAAEAAASKVATTMVATRETDASGAGTCVQPTTKADASARSGPQADRTDPPVAGGVE